MANKITSKQHKGEEVLQKNLVHKIHKKTVYNQLLGGQAGTAALVEKRFPWHTPLKPGQGFLDNISETGGECGCDMGLR